MRLLSTNVHERLVIKVVQAQTDQSAPSHVPYAILSHTWQPDEDEVSFLDLRDTSAAELKPGWNKVTRAREQAYHHGLDWIWIDTCCIDKTSSTELSEAINTMFYWYQHASACYVYLADMPDTAVSTTKEKSCSQQGDALSRDQLLDVEHSTLVGEAHLQRRLPTATEFCCLEDLDFDICASCRWFYRGWTLQEMLAPAPSVLFFFDAAWKLLGNLEHLAHLVSRITTIHIDLLVQDTTTGLCRKRMLEDFSIAQRLSWAAKRDTTRIEDRAYSLLGLFQINMPVVYGEQDGAFRRLQEAIIRKYPGDTSIFLWSHDASVPGYRPTNRLFAQSPSNFNGCDDLVATTRDVRDDFQITSSGIVIEVSTIQNRVIDGKMHAMAILPYCRLHTSARTLLALFLRREDGPDENYVVAGLRQIDSIATFLEAERRTITIKFEPGNRTPNANDLERSTRDAYIVLVQTAVDSAVRIAIRTVTGTSRWHAVGRGGYFALSKAQDDTSFPESLINFRAELTINIAGFVHKLIIEICIDRWFLSEPRVNAFFDNEPQETFIHVEAELHKVSLFDKSALLIKLKAWKSQAHIADVPETFTKKMTAREIGRTVQYLP